MIRKLIIIPLIISTFPTFAAAGKYIARVNEGGDILFERDSGFSADVREVEISGIDGFIYVSFTTSGARLRKFDENGYYDSGFDLTAMHSTYDFDIDAEDFLWIPGNAYRSSSGVYKYNNMGSEEFSITDFAAHNASADDYPQVVWVGGHSVHDDLLPGVHRFTYGGTRNLYLSEYRPYKNSCDINNGGFWFIDHVNGRADLVKLDEEGNESVRNSAFEAPDDPQASTVDGGCWFIDYYKGDLYKLDAFGSIVFHDGSFNDIAAIDVNESDGSVWVASNVPKRLVHLDKDGNRELYKQWPGGDFAHLAVDQRNGTCIVIYEESKSGDLNIQPASVGEIKAMYR
jgi:hypothetical protein